MNRKRFFFLLIYLFPFILNAQNWLPLSSGLDGSVRSLFFDTIDNNLYVGGQFKIAGGDTIAGIARWDGTQFYPMGCGFDWDCPNLLCGGCFPLPTFAITRYKNEIYAAGAFQMADDKPIKYIAKWDGFTWDSVGTTFNNDAVIGALKVINNELYAAGFINAIGGLPICRIAKWDGLEWKNVNNFPCSFGPYINAVEFYKGELYVAGNFQGDSGRNDICKWNGQNWVSVGGGLSGGGSWVNKLYIWNDTLFVGGYFQKSNGDPGNNIAAWDGNSWLDLGEGIKPSNVFDLVEFENSLFVCGQFDSAGDVHADFIAKWNGDQWCSLGSDFDNAVFSLAANNNELYAGGAFKTIDSDSVHYIAKWTGGNYSDTCGVIIGQSEISRSKSEIFLFPNPATEILTIAFSAEKQNVHYEIFDLTGKMVERSKIIFAEQNISLKNYSPGIYLLKISADEKNYSQKFIRE